MFPLTDEQRRAVQHDGGHLLIVAGAGTGKTTTLAARLAHLVESGVAPERILLLTFSRRAAAEVINRAEVAAGARALAAVGAGTFHAVASRHLRRYGRLIGIDPAFTVLDGADVADLLALVRDELPTQGDARRRRARKETMAAVLSRVVNARRPLPEVLARHFPWVADQEAELRATFGAYLDRKRTDGVVDYDDLLLLWRALLAVPAATTICDQIDHVLVDEYQDTNPLQAEVLEALAAAGATLTAVGDDAQAIFGFRAATVRNILDFPARFGATVVPLTRNHRSTGQILATANALGAEMVERHEKSLVAVRPDGARPELVTCHDESAQAVAVCERLLAQVERGVDLRRQAVLVRTGHHSDLLEVELTMRGIPFVKYGGLRFLESAHVKDLLATVRVVQNPADRLAWTRVLLLLDDVGPSRARRAAEVGGAGRAVEVGVLPRKAADAAAALDDAIEAARRAPSAGAAVEAVRGWLDDRIRACHPHAEARLGDLDRLAQAAALAPSLERFLTDLTLDPPASTSDLAGPPSLDDDVLTISTIHGAKGGEWDVVHVLHLADGCVPSDMATGDADEIEEERRLLYVALTRARDRLHAYVPLRYHHHRQRLDDRHSLAARSRFLTDDVVATMDEVVAQRVDPLDDPIALAAAVNGVGRVDDLVRALLG
jgi:DNA helicase II / ATP-dependent DNA helicase PcrA